MLWCSSGATYSTTARHQAHLPHHQHLCKCAHHGAFFHPFPTSACTQQLWQSLCTAHHTWSSPVCTPCAACKLQSRSASPELSCTVHIPKPLGVLQGNASLSPAALATPPVKPKRMRKVKDINATSATCPPTTVAALVQPAPKPKRTRKVKDSKTTTTTCPLAATAVEVQPPPKAKRARKVKDIKPATAPGASTPHQAVQPTPAQAPQLVNATAIHHVLPKPLHALQPANLFCTLCTESP